MERERGRERKREREREREGRERRGSVCDCSYGVATISMLLKIIGLFCKRAL